MSTLDWLSLAVYQATNQRYSQEDRWVAQPMGGGYLLAVLDGHGHSSVADLAAGRLTHYFQLGLEHELPGQQRADAAFRADVEANLTPEDIQAWIEQQDPRWFEAKLRSRELIEADEADKRAFFEQLAWEDLINSAVWDHRHRGFWDDPVAAIHEALRETVAQLVEDFSRKGRTGATLSMAYILPDKDQLRLFTAQLGDSAIVILTPAGEVHVTAEHSVQNCEADRAVIQAAIDRLRELDDPPNMLRRAMLKEDYVITGPTVSESYGLAVTRALGDTDFEGLLLREPELQDFTVPRDSLILGVTDGVHNTETLEGRHAAYRAIADRLAAGESLEAIGADLVSQETLTDNITMVALREAIDPRPIVATLDVWQDGETAYVLTQSLPEEHRGDIRIAGLFDHRALLMVDGDEGVKLWVVRQFERRKGIRFEYRHHEGLHHGE